MYVWFQSQLKTRIWIYWLAEQTTSTPNLLKTSEVHATVSNCCNSVSYPDKTQQVKVCSQNIKVFLLPCCWAFVQQCAVWAGRKWPGFSLYLLFIAAAFLRGIRGGIWCLCVIVLEPSHMLSPVHLLSPLLICAVCLQISDILLRLGSGVCALPTRRERDPQRIPMRCNCIFSYIILL